MTKRVRLDRLRDISRYRSFKPADEARPTSDLGHDEQKLTIERPIEAESHLLPRGRDGSI